MKMKILTTAILPFFLITNAAWSNEVPLERTIEQWDTSCKKCHGSDGAGKTKAGRKLRVRDYTKADVQAEMKEDEMIKAIVEGIFEKDEEKMQAYKDDYSEAEIKAFVTYIRSLKK